VPPLRERKEDVPLLARHFLKEFSAAYGRRTREITDDSIETLMRYSWPGNVRELRNVIERIVIMNPTTSKFERKHLPPLVYRDGNRRTVGTEFASLHEARSAFLEAEAKKAKTPEQRAVFDSHRLSEYIALKEPEKAIPMLEQSQKDLPNDYNPPARLAAAYKAMGKFDEAIAANDRALALAYGPRKIGIFRSRADIYIAKGDPATAKKILNDAIAFAESLPEGQRSDRTIASLKKKLETM